MANHKAEAVLTKQTGDKPSEKVRGYIHNRFDVEVRDAKTGELKQKAFAENILLDTLFSTVAWHAPYGSGWAAYIAIGMGTGTLDRTRTTMFNKIAHGEGTNATYIYDDANKVFSKRIQWTISETQYNGSTITEIGVGQYWINNYQFYLCSHALLKDMNGNTASIIKTDTDIITFYATVYAVVPNTFDSGAIKTFPGYQTSLVLYLLGSITWPTNDTFYFQKTCDLQSTNRNYNGWDTASVSVAITHDASGKIWTHTAARLAVGSGNEAGGIYGMQSSNGFNFNFLDSSVFTGSVITGENLGVGDGTTQDFKTAFGLVKAGAVVKVDGTVDATATVDVGKPYENNLIRHMKVIAGNNSVIYPGYYHYDGNFGAGAAYVILENPLYAAYGIDTIRCEVTTLECSDNLVDWTSLGSGSASKDVSANRTARYWKFTTASGYYGSLDQFLSNDLGTAALKNVHFATPPATGAVLTIDYTTQVLAKDAYHVFDCTAQLEIDEYTP